jgi:hypothetical protein
MRHYILTRSAYGPDVSVRTNRERLALLAGVTAPSLRAQTNRDVTWLVLIDPADPLLGPRLAAIAAAGLPYIAAPAEGMTRAGIHDRPYGPWAKHIDWDGGTLTTRLDDDDALAPFAMERVRAAAEGHEGRAMWTLPTGFRIVGRMSYRIHWSLSQFVTLQTPAGDRATVCDVNHMAFATLAPLLPATEDPAWLWVRHRLTRSRVEISRQRRHIAGRTEGGPVRITPALRSAFPVDWALIERQL